MTSHVWYRATLRDDPIAAGLVATIRDQFAEALGDAGWPDGACLFLIKRHTRRGKERRDGAVEAIFFSPAAIAEVPHLIAACGAEPGPPPDRARASLLVGKQSDWDLLPRPTH